MALPPTVPTSFVPKQPVQTTRRARTGTNLFLFVSLIIMLAAVVGSVAVFGYDQYLNSVQKQKAEELAVAEASISRDTVEEFIRLRDRLTAASTLLDEHVALSQFFDVLEAIGVKNIQFEELSIEVADDRSAKLDMTGEASTFNALAAESAAFAAEKRIRRAIFSGISTNERGIVEFSLEAELEPQLVVWNGQPFSAAPIPVTPATVPTPSPITPVPVPATSRTPTVTPQSPSSPVLPSVTFPAP